MNPYQLYHQPKSNFAYMYDNNTVHLRLLATRGTIDHIAVIYGDPFHWGPAKDDPTKWVWQQEGIDHNQMIKEYQTEEFDHFFLAVKPATKRMKYAFVINDTYLYGSRDIVLLADYPNARFDHSNFFNYPYLNEEDMFSAPLWVKDQIWYSIFPERFANGDPSTNPDGTLLWGDTDTYSNHQRFGGDLQGIIDRLDYIQHMGFTGLYMTPIFPSDSSHKYDVNDYYDIDPAFGDKDTFHQLVTEAHKRGIKIMLDAVFNHCGFRHPYFQDVLKHGKQSQYYDCFYIIDDSLPVFPLPLRADGSIDRKQARHLFKDKSTLNYRTFAFTPFMPKLRATNPLMKDYLLGAASFWIQEYDIDGWRLDVSDEVPHTFWRDFRKTVKTAKQDAYIIGENWSNSMPWLQGDQYDGVMNYELLFPIWDFFGSHPTRRTSSATAFRYKVNQVLTNYPKNVLPYLYNLVDSHDTTRILQICDNNVSRVKLPYLFLFSFPGAPSVYYGGEIGLTGEHDPDNRRCMVWDEDNWNHELQQFLRQLIQLRKTTPAFTSVDFIWHRADDQAGTLLYQKEDVLFALSRSSEPTTIPLPNTLQQRSYHNLATDETGTTQSTLSLPAYGYQILQLQ